MTPSLQEMSMDKSKLLSRRTVFAGAGTAGALAGAAVLLPLTEPTQVTAADEGASARLDADGRYQLTPHVRQYYQTAKV
jgi:hypothetical protein